MQAEKTTGGELVCVFVNLKQDTIVVEKRTAGGDGTFSFTGDLGAFDLTTTQGAPTGLGSATPPFSITNLQEAGVDEADPLSMGMMRIVAFVSSLIRASMAGSPFQPAFMKPRLVRMTSLKSS